MSVTLRVRRIHPVAWWLWAAALAICAIRTTNPILLMLLAAVVCFVVAFRRPEAPWARSLGFFLRVGLFVIAIRLAFEIVFGVRGIPGHVLFTLPSVQLPVHEDMAVGGPVTLEGMLNAFVQGLRLAVIVVCFGAANSMSSPYRLLRSLPSVLYEAGVAVSVALSFAPELVLTLGSVREARRLRGRPATGVAGMRGVAVPVLEGALDRSIGLAASMDARGYGRRPAVASRRWSTGCVMAGMLLALVGTYGVLVPSSLYGLGLPAVVAATVLLGTGLLAASRRRGRTRYRPDPWRLPEWVVAGSGVAALVAFVAASWTNTIGLQVGFQPLAWPPLPLLPVVGTLLALAPLAVTEPPRSRQRAR
jgi:energy-coupling factor transport system permease protein